MFISPKLRKNDGGIPWTFKIEYLMKCSNNNIDSLEYY